jgi:hypothetical protein
MQNIIQVYYSRNICNELPLTVHYYVNCGRYSSMSSNNRRQDINGELHYMENEVVLRSHFNIKL